MEVIDQHIKGRTWAALVSLIVGTALMGLKFLAYHFTGSTAVLSDALESIVNVVTASMAVWIVRAASRPPDENHPYGHGKFEFFSATFEGGLIAFAALTIAFEAVQALMEGPQIKDLGLGIALLAIAGLVNLLLGLYLINRGKKNHSVALVSSGRHVISDFWTSFGVVVAVALVAWTGWLWLDPIVAICVAIWLAWTGYKIMREAFAGLTDEEDPQSLERFRQSVIKFREPGIIQVHYARIIRSGLFEHVDAHVVVPEYWSVSESHERVERYTGKIVRDQRPLRMQIAFHVDPCRMAYCKVCDQPDCPIRKEEFEGLREITLETLTRSTEPTEFARKGRPLGKSQSDPF